mmetsp:Transcript_18777/g.46960  ORF Transcript_18777/g.46960 Transcript_18777/m.46960 type:complete len:262 (-) Transcript_18777:181-966(-)|eukprot:CAMPEP_0178991292 /NCGR_PEP_ID=MMETSP0795-20121207/5440_1 /TAXON_ID=88552 /ORGANISM="Amoebophrya sp., Strain Ameob2" /LENGTH=261 /DNA_ID=CAMNT_0020682971 /DNA_START=69 /DNA_END=854 /DNA_ORIENTATION=+
MDSAFLLPAGGSASQRTTRDEQCKDLSDKEYQYSSVVTSSSPSRTATSSTTASAQLHRTSGHRGHRSRTAELQIAIEEESARHSLAACFLSFCHDATTMMQTPDSVVYVEGAAEETSTATATATSSEGRKNYRNHPGRLGVDVDQVQEQVTNDRGDPTKEMDPDPFPSGAVYNAAPEGSGHLRPSGPPGLALAHHPQAQVGGPPAHPYSSYDQKLVPRSILGQEQLFTIPTGGEEAAPRVSQQELLRQMSVRTPAKKRMWL